MNDVTLVQISVACTLLMGLWKAWDFFNDMRKGSISTQLEKALEPTNKKLDELDKKLDAVDLNATKNFLVATMDDFKKKDERDPIV